MPSAPLLRDVRIASPCKADWNSMSGDDRVRFCGTCSLHVVDLSAMRAAEAESFLRERAGAGRTCVRLWRRTDGTVLTRDCPVGLRRRARLAAGRFAAAFAVLLFGASACRPSPGSDATGTPTTGGIAPQATPQPGLIDEMGDVLVPTMGEAEYRELGEVHVPPATK